MKNIEKNARVRPWSGTMPYMAGLSLRFTGEVSMSYVVHVEMSAAEPAEMSIEPNMAFDRVALVVNAIICRTRPGRASEKSSAFLTKAISWRGSKATPCSLVSPDATL